jgi:hypothetical protein
MKHRIIRSVIVIMLSGVVGCGDRGAKRLPEAGFQVEFQSHNVASEMTSGKTVSADIMVKNISPVTWPSKPDNKDRYAVKLSYHWLNRKGEKVIFEGVRTSLPRDLKPGESVDLKAAIQAPAKPGRYILEVTLVQESAAWFPDKNGAKLPLPVTVVGGGEVTADSAADTSRSEPTQNLKRKPRTSGNRR